MGIAQAILADTPPRPEPRRPEVEPAPKNPPVRPPEIEPPMPGEPPTRPGWEPPPPAPPGPEVEPPGMRARTTAV